MAFIKIKTSTYNKTRKTISTLTKNIFAQTDKTGYNMVRSAASRGREYIIQNTHGEKILAQSIKTERTADGKSQTWSIFQDEQMTRNHDQRGHNYAIDVDQGFIPHYAPVTGNPNLQRWIVRNLGNEALKTLMKKGYMRVGFSTPWNNAGGLRYVDYMFNHVVTNINQMDSAIDKGIRG